MPFLRSHIRATTSSWRNQSPSIRLIRLWLGVTWIYGGWDKATDPNFLAATGATSIKKQLTGYAGASPIGFVFRHMIERSTTVGIIVMISEFAIGIATLLWIAPTFIAFVGFTMSIGLWLAVTWHVHPCFLGSDTAYAILWLSYFLALVGKRRKVDISLDRRGAMRLAFVGVAAVAASGAGRLIQKKAPASSAASGKKIVASSALLVGQTHEFTTSTGEPAILFRTANGVFAYSEICTHEGCTVAFSATDKALVCPCHGATYDPYNDAVVLSGPTRIPLSKISVAEQSGWIVQL